MCIDRRRTVRLRESQSTQQYGLIHVCFWSKQTFPSHELDFGLGPVMALRDMLMLRRNGRDHEKRN